MIELREGVIVDYVNGEAILKVQVAALLVPKLDELKAKVESGEIDLVKGTDLDKLAIVAVIESLKNEIKK